MAASDHLGPQFKVSQRRMGGLTRFDAHLGGQNVGYLVAEPREPSGTFLDSVYTHPEHRGHGVANELVTRAVKKFGHEDMELHAQPFEELPGEGEVFQPGKGTGPNREGLMSFYGKHGFTPSDGYGRMLRRGQ